MVKRHKAQYYHVVIERENGVFKRTTHADVGAAEKVAASLERSTTNGQVYVFPTDKLWHQLDDRDIVALLIEAKNWNAKKQVPV